ncbi:phosphoribosylformylglycinamidine synthase [Thermosipho melanesiensis]|uniref:Phosphoribosylformylglycinamidine synthase subunit PurS n=2 Tax=Thermosipho melanesiensis TaxID=46541 RepID=A6LMD6_THEM4|nr:phosphoribosylformylglycinamidine synthase subunit PurS [Thermosipho melanesiensis]ABR31087.1 phosphoribosylformylglycinamidine synthase, purS [Thermosipho melanesiensis BI429]APT74182.1 phosphoribosylformylglycinamidine synthase [Thermosipho melanesiensis]OOC36126.1 phosphoribosylformylglycinamidine synthase [Thermosipho melanesiensis]OOC36943.1 phosphoribosylformylglycinamidine synthase [Thermosipho melanesiensis]OOC37695.1 phosphoribosylformylglycinamidine synthase [Thermosipho melanesie
MQKFKFVVDIQYKSNVRDPRGETIARVLREENDIPVESIRIGKSIHGEILANDKAEAERKVVEACEKLLVNPVTEEYEVKIE